MKKAISWFASIAVVAVGTVAVVWTLVGNEHVAKSAPNESIYRVCQIGSPCDVSLAGKMVLKTIGHEPGWDYDDDGQNIVAQLEFLDPSTSCPAFTAGTYAVWDAMAAGPGGRVNGLGWTTAGQEVNARTRAKFIDSDTQCGCFYLASGQYIEDVNCDQNQIRVWKMVADVD